jgi:hypothetical protein
MSPLIPEKQSKYAIRAIFMSLQPLNPQMIEKTILVWPRTTVKCPRLNPIGITLWYMCLGAMLHHGRASQVPAYWSHVQPAVVGFRYFFARRLGNSLFLQQVPAGRQRFSHSFDADPDLFDWP